MVPFEGRVVFNAADARVFDVPGDLAAMIPVACTDLFVNLGVIADKRYIFSALKISTAYYHRLHRSNRTSRKHRPYKRDADAGPAIALPFDLHLDQPLADGR